MAFTPFVESDQPTMANFNEKFLQAILEGKDQALAAGVKIETGSYVGTGEWNVYTSITLTHIPEILIVQREDSGGHPSIWIKGTTHFITWISTAHGGICPVTIEGNTISWIINHAEKMWGYSATSSVTSSHTDAQKASWQLNTTNTIYKYIAIG